MPTELVVLALAAVLLLLHLLLAGHYRTRQFGVQWNMGPRDGDPGPLDPVPGRLLRAQNNYLETLPMAIIALFGVVLTNKTSGLTAIVAWVWLAARAAYLPIYWAGIAGVRSAVWGVATLAILVVLGVLVFG